MRNKMKSLSISQIREIALKKGIQTTIRGRKSTKKELIEKIIEHKFNNEQ